MPNQPSPVEMPRVPDGLTTQISKAVMALSLVIGAIFAILDGDHSEVVIGALATGLVTLWSLTQSRGKQAAAAVTAAGIAVAAGAEPPVRNWDDDFEPPDEDDTPAATADRARHEQRDIHDAPGL